MRAGDWTKITTPHFTVFSEASEGRTRDWAVEFELFRRGLAHVVTVDAAQSGPVTLVLFGSDRRLKPFKPLEKGKPSRVAGYFVRIAERNMIAISVAGARDDVREVIYHEGVHWYLAGLDRRPPVWLEEGLAEVFGTFALHGNAFSYGNPRPDYVRLIRVMSPMPMTRLAELSRGTMRYNGAHESTARLFYAQSWAVVHQLMFDDALKGREALQRLLHRSMDANDSDEAIEAAMGCSYAETDARLNDYLLRRSYQRQQIPFNRAEIDAGFSLQPVEDSEVDLVLGGLLLGVERPDEAAPYLRRAAGARFEDPSPWELLGQMEWMQGHRAEAASYFEQALVRGSRSAVTHLYLGQSELAPGMLSRGTIQSAASHFAAAIHANPRHEIAYEGLATTTTMLRDEAGAETEALLRQGEQRFPANPRLQLALAMTELKSGKSETAGRRLQRVLASPDLDNPTAAFTRELVAEWERKAEGAKAHATARSTP